MAEKDYKKLKKSVQRLSSDLKSQAKDFKKTSDKAASTVDSLKKNIDGTATSYGQAKAVLEMLIAQWIVHADSIIKLKADLEKEKSSGNGNKAKKMEKDISQIEGMAETLVGKMEAQFETVKKIVADMDGLGDKVSKI